MSNGSHYYHPVTGELIEGNLRDARKVGGLPSPTTVLKILSSPGLKYYFRRQMWEAACTTPRAPGMTDEEHWEACQKWADEHGQAARDAGGDFHSLIQKFHEQPGLTLPMDHPLKPQFDAYVDWYDLNVKRTILVEQSVIGNGYAGRLDHFAELWDGRKVVMDGKTQDTTKKKGKFVYYTEWSLQLGAYGGALLPHQAPDALMSVCVSRNLPVRVEAYTWPKPPKHYYELFMGLLNYWREDNAYWP